ncbi:hypothetical protein FH972_009590 [Carpinus fangiana]|uniref:Uncharacterized protein n=1 Tax=Carpinus fangiana TaxID=176857 RepID=A0A660KRV9_9ROSI|nr:hypothetical protein FH972_009590 [Carpinus fangiana]
MTSFVELAKDPYDNYVLQGCLIHCDGELISEVTTTHEHAELPTADTDLAVGASSTEASTSIDLPTTLTKVAARAELQTADTEATASIGSAKAAPSDGHPEASAGTGCTEFAVARAGSAEFAVSASCAEFAASAGRRSEAAAGIETAG